MKTEDEKVFLRRTPQGFVPAYDRDVDLLSHIPVGAIVSTRPKRPRRVRRHRWWWALLNRVADSHPFYSRAEQVLTHLKMRTGWNRQNKNACELAMLAERVQEEWAQGREAIDFLDRLLVPAGPDEIITTIGRCIEIRHDVPNTVGKVAST